MSNVKLQGNVSGTGSVTITSPNTNSDRTITLPDSSGTFVVDGASQSPTFNAVTTTTLSVAGNNISAVNSMGFRNRIINGDMRIDQRNAGASVTPTAHYTLDRWLVYESTDGAISVQQVSDAPAGFSNSLKATTTTADSSLGSTQYCYLEHRVEGYNFADMNFGTSSAQNVTLSFQVKSSLTGTFGGVLMNSANNRCYPFTYTINAANTWETKSVTVAGDTTGTWVGATNGIGIRVIFGWGIGSAYSGTAGAWTGSELYSPTGAVPLIGTLNATWQITGVQLEAGSVASPFERRDYGRELMMCERYYQRISGFVCGTGTNAAQCGTSVMYKTEMRTSPSVGLTAALSITQPQTNDFTQSSPSINISLGGARVNSLGVTLNFENFTGLPNNTALPAIVTGGILTFSSEL